MPTIGRRRCWCNSPARAASAMEERYGTASGQSELWPTANHGVCSPDSLIFSPIVGAVALGAHLHKRKCKSAGRQSSFFETLEDRRLLSATLSASQSLMVFNAVKNSSASPTETLTLTDTGSDAITLGSSGIKIV